MFLDYNSGFCFFFFFSCFKQECDQVHIEDVASDDNGQDLRWRTEECMKRIADAMWIIFAGLQKETKL